MVQCSGYSLLNSSRKAEGGLTVTPIMCKRQSPKREKVHMVYLALDMKSREVTRMCLTTVSDGTSGKISSQFLWVLEEGNSLCVGRAHATSDVRNPPVGGEKCKEKEQLVVINPSLSREFP